MRQTDGVLLSSDVAVRVEQVGGDYLCARLTALSRLPGNPHGVEVRRVGDGYAFVVRAVANALFNHVEGLTDATIDQLGELADWYAAHGRRLRVEVTPAQASPALFAALTGHGLAQTGFYAGLYGEPSAHTVGAGDSIRVEPADVDEFADCYVRGFGFPVARQAILAESIRVLAGHPSADFYRARIGTATAGVGLLFRQDGVGYLATAATLPEHRGNGVQTALVRHRIAAAADAEYDLIAGHATVGSTSHRTMERCGLRLAFTKSIWSRPG